MRLTTPTLVALLAVSVAGVRAAAQDPTTIRPNVVLILADDLGYGDLRCYNPERGKIPTPHLDRLAERGMRFTDAHSSSAVCSPSRYTLLTGRYHWRTRLQSGIVNLWERPLIAPDRLTLASLAKRQGYRTAAIGKWHLGWDWPITPEQRPQFAGLGGKPGGGGEGVVTTPTEEQRRTWSAVFSQPLGGGPTARGFDLYFGTDVPNWPPYCFIENDRTAGVPTDLLPKEMLRKNQGSLQGPALPNWKFEPILPALADRASSFIGEAAKKPEPFFLYLPLTTPHTPLAVNPEWRGRSGLESEAADLIMETDAAVGRVLQALEQSGAARNTLVLFTADNGFAAYAGAKELEARGHYPSGPLRDYKSSVHEGGHREPFIVSWPGVVKPGTVNSQLVHHADLMATLAELWGEKLPPNAGEDSFSLLPLLRGGDQPVREHAISCAASGQPSLRKGSWKVIPSARPAGLPRLYDLSTDLSETRDRAAEKPELVGEMQALLERLIIQGRSTPGPRQKNDVRVRRFPPAPRNPGSAIEPKQ